jgi:aryl-alcohol dehydrogenase-like predicted oxidoreductase
MERRILGRTGLEVNPLGFGCGAVGGLMTRGAAHDQERAVARALELGINYFDTAPIYGDGESEKSLGRVWKVLRPAAYVGTKVRLAPITFGGHHEAALRSAWPPTSVAASPPPSPTRSRRAFSACRGSEWTCSSSTT